MKKEKPSVIKRITSSREVSLLIILVAISILVTLQSPSFMTYSSIMDMLRNNAVLMIMTVGMLCVLLIGGIDISITSTLAMTGMTIGMLVRHNVVTNTLLLFLLSLVIGTVCGLIVGLVISKGRVLPIIATMGFMYIYRGLAFLIANNQWASAADLSEFRVFALGEVLGINNVVLIMLIIFIIFFFVMKWTKIGRKIYAVGSNIEAAAISGINTDNVQLLVYTIMGTLSGFSGALAVSVYASAQPNMLFGREMDVIAGCVIGGVSMQGGRGTVVGAFLGSLILAVIAKALPLVGIESIAQNTVKGVLILVVVILNVITQRGMEKKNLKEREI